MEAVSSSMSPLTNRHDVLFQKTFAQLDDWARFAPSVQKRTSAQNVLLYYSGVTNRTTGQQNNPRQLTCNTPAQPPHLYSIYIHPQNCFSFQCVPIVQNQSYASVLRRRYKYRRAVSQQRQADERALFAGITSTEFMSPMRHFPICIPVRSVPAGLRLLPCPPVLQAVHTQDLSTEKKLQVTRVKL